MRRKIVAALIILVASGLSATGAFVHQQDASTADPIVRKSEFAHQRDGHAAPAVLSVRSIAQTLERDMKIASGSFRSVGPKAYEIVRAREFRPQGDALLHAKQLQLRVELGDANAAYEIHLTVQQCQTFASARADQLAGAAASVGGEGWFLQRSERLLGECESLVLDKTLQQEDWLSRAAAMGSQEAMRAYALSPEQVIGSLTDSIREPERLSQWKETAVMYLNDLAAQGNLTAIGDLERAHASGRFSEPDPARALAYAQVVQRINPNLVTNEDLSHYTKDMSAEDMKLSTLLSNRVYQQCCINQ